MLLLFQYIKKHGAEAICPQKQICIRTQRKVTLMPGLKTSLINEDEFKLSILENGWELHKYIWRTA